MIQLNNINKNYTHDIVLDNLNLKINDGDHIAIVGENGCGKSTLLKIIAGIENIQSGQIIIPKQTKIGYLSQQFEAFDGNVRSFLLSSFEYLLKLEKQMKYLEQQLIEVDADYDVLLKKYGNIQQAYEENDGYIIEALMENIANGLSIINILDNDYATLSGGEKTRVNLAALLLKRCDVLLLDEPTNHLDFYGIAWLENYISALNTTCVIVSHDRVFLNNTIKHIYELEYGTLNEYHGNYDYYKVEKAKRLEILKQNFEEQQKEIKRINEAIRRFRTWGTIGDNKKFFIKAKQLERRLEMLDIINRPIQVHRKLTLNIKWAERSSKDILQINNLSKFYDQQCLFKDVCLAAYYQDSIAIIGANGMGKSTLIKLLLNEETPTSGTITWATNATIGYLPQVVVFKNEKHRLLEYFMYYGAMSEEQARSYLTRFGFYACDAPRVLKYLSGGERIRLQLAIILAKPINTLILDEPTNHLDFTSIEIMEDVLKEFQGTLLVVSHDRYFIDSLVKTKWYIENQTIREERTI